MYERASRITNTIIKDHAHYITIIFCLSWKYLFVVLSFPSDMLAFCKKAQNKNNISCLPYTYGMQILWRHPSVKHHAIISFSIRCCVWRWQTCTIVASYYTVGTWTCFPKYMCTSRMWVELQSYIKYNLVLMMLFCCLLLKCKYKRHPLQINV